MRYKDEDEAPTFAELAERANSRKEVAVGIRERGQVVSAVGAKVQFHHKAPLLLGPRQCSDFQ